LANLTLKQYDTYPSLQATLTDSNGAINLTGASSVKFVMKGQSTGTIVLGNCSIVSATAGTVAYAWGATDTQTPDVYSVEFQITWTAGGIQKVPNAAAANPTVEIDADLDGTLG
jgi:hypothetical protein